MFALWAILIPIIDQVTKALVINQLPVYDSIAIIPGVLSLTHVRNPGAAFGILAYQRPLFVAIAVILIVASVIFRRRIEHEPFIVRIGLGLGLGGAIGNLVDRLRTGYVTDFLDMPFIPIFNVADTAIVIGVTLLLWASFFHKEAPNILPKGGESPSEG